MDGGQDGEGAFLKEDEEDKQQIHSEGKTKARNGGNTDEITKFLYLLSSNTCCSSER